MAFYDPNINAFVPHQKDGAKIIKINETTGEQYEIDNPDYTPLKEYTQEEIDGFFALISQGYKMQPADDGTVLLTPPAPKTDEEIKAELRIKREPLLEAFDKWEKAVLRNREQDSVVIMGWYQDLLDLIPSAFENIPERIKYYL